MVWAAILWSVLAILWLARINPKRRRTLGLDPLSRAYPAWLGWALCFLPFPILLIWGSNADLVNWMGAVCAFGWMAVAVTPAHIRSIAAWLDRCGKSFEAYIQTRLR